MAALVGIGSAPIVILIDWIVMHVLAAPTEVTVSSSVGTKAEKTEEGSGSENRQAATDKDVDLWRRWLA